jgi:hypothetical protein
MTVDVNVMPQARHDLLQLLTARMPTPLDARLAAVLFYEEVVRLMRRYADPPPGAVVRARAGGGWWLFAGGVWLAFDRFDETTGRWPLRRRRRRFTIVAAAARPPQP